jgi:hypothetical protein
MRKLKVYGWMSTRREATGTHQQTREIVATTSMAECARIAGVKGPHALRNLCETGNGVEITVATSQPGVVFWKSQHPNNDNWKMSLD